MKRPRSLAFDSAQSTWRTRSGSCASCSSGTLNTAFSYLVYALLLLVGLHYAVANLGAVVLGIIFSFKTQGVLVFRDPRNALFAKYVASWIVIYGANVALIALFVRFGLILTRQGWPCSPLSFRHRTSCRKS